MAHIERGIVYTETIVHSAPEKYSADIPYQLAIIEGPDGGRSTVRIEPGHRVEIGDAVEFADERGGVAYYRKQ